jgi:hypothetical protein
MQSGWPVKMPASIGSALHRYTTHVVAALILVVGVTGMMMFYRLYKSSVQEMHAWIGMAFLLAIVLHATRNRRQLVPLFSHARMYVLLAMTGTVAASFLYLAPAPKANPAKSLTQVFVRAPLINIALVLGITPELALARMRAAGVETPALDQSIEDAAKRSHADPMKLLVALLHIEKKY